MTARKATVDPEAILAAAAPLFAAKGLAATTTREIAEAAGISEGSLYNYFDSKREVFIACMGARERVQALIQNLEQVGTGELEPLLAALSLKLIEFMSQQLPVMMQLALAGEVKNVKRQGRLDLLISEHVFAPRVRSGELRGDPLVLARFFMGMCQALAFQDRFLGVPFKHQLNDFLSVFLDGAANRKEAAK